MLEQSLRGSVTMFVRVNAQSVSGSCLLTTKTPSPSRRSLMKHQESKFSRWNLWKAPLSRRYRPLRRSKRTGSGHRSYVSASVRLSSSITCRRIPTGQTFYITAKIQGSSYLTLAHREDFPGNSLTSMCKTWQLQLEATGKRVKNCLSSSAT